MTENVFLIGSEDVQRAGYAMQGAAATIQSAANTISDALFQHRQFMDDWLARLECVLKEHKE